MRIDISPRLARYVSIALREFIDRERTCGGVPPRELAALRDRLLIPESDTVTRDRALARARKARQRERRLLDRAS